MMNGRLDVQGRASLPPIYAFGSFRFDALRGMLYHGDTAVPLPQRLAGLLALLIRSNGEVVEKETIASRVWPDCAVSDGNLSQHVYMLRQILDERARDRTYVMTVRGKGYRFVAAVSIVAPAATDYSRAATG
jgi:DNA-binding winged helix-turn-helix (wHTH) protein